jgi:hypothetical protein
MNLDNDNIVVRYLAASPDGLSSIRLNPTKHLIYLFSEWFITLAPHKSCLLISPAQMSALEPRFSFALDETYGEYLSNNLPACVYSSLQVQR